MEPGTIIDIGGSLLPSLLEDMTCDLFLKPASHSARTIPTELFYDCAGLQIWREIIRTKEYYQTMDEIQLLQHHGGEIAQWIMSGCMIVDMGSGYVFLPSSSWILSSRKQPVDTLSPSGLGIYER
jgi:hypothetical protein